MKKMLIMSMALAASVAAHAYDYPWLAVEQADGTTQKMNVEQLVLTFVNGQLVTTNGDGSQTFTLTALSKMYFSESGMTGISDLGAATDDGKVEVVTLNGVSMGRFANLEVARQQLKSGVYVVKSKNKTIKIAVK